MNAPFAKMTKSKSKKSTKSIEIKKIKRNQKNQNDIKGKSKSFHPWKNNKFCMGKIAKIDVTASSKMKIFIWGRTQAHLEFFFIGKGTP
jgi:hypothetical protein